MESQIRGKFAKVGATNTGIKAKINQKFHKGTNDASKTLLKFRICFSAITIILLFNNIDIYFNFYYFFLLTEFWDFVNATTTIRSYKKRMLLYVKG